jgi:predicted DNA-binding mobile mystery protein A
MVLLAGLSVHRTFIAIQNVIIRIFLDVHCDDVCACIDEQCFGCIMRDNFRTLRSQQLDRMVLPLRAIKLPRPPKGWIRAFREAMGVSYAELAERLQASRSLAAQQEKAEIEDRITLKSLRACASALDCDLVYAFVPRGESIEATLAARARESASGTRWFWRTKLVETWNRQSTLKRGAYAELRDDDIHYWRRQHAADSRRTGRPHSQPCNQRRVESMGAREHSGGLLMGSESANTLSGECPIRALHSQPAPPYV